MKILLPALVSIGCLASNAVSAHVASADKGDEQALQASSVQDEVVITAMHGQLDGDASLSQETQSEGQAAGKKRLHGLLPPGLYIDAKRPGLSGAINDQFPWPDNQTPQLMSWLDGSNGGDQRFMLGYRWKRLSIEGAAQQAARGASENPVTQQGSTMRANWRSTRLSFTPAENWLIKLSRGAVSNLDNLVPGEQVRRTALAATYSLPFSTGGWETTLAWGRNARKNRESHSGYLLESTLRLAGVHSMFGRIEQVGSDSLMRENEALQRQLFKLNRVTLGYYQDLRIQGPVGMDVGAFVSRHLVPSDMTSSYGKDPTAYMVFVRLKLQ